MAGSDKESEDSVTFEMPPGAAGAMDAAEQEQTKRLDAALEEAREAGVLDECGCCNAAFDLLKPYMKPDEAHIETLIRVLAELAGANRSLGLAKAGDLHTALERSYTAYFEEAHRLGLLLEEATDCVLMLRGDLQEVRDALGMAAGGRGLSYAEEIADLEGRAERAEATLAVIAHVLFEPRELSDEMPSLRERILGSIAELVRERTEARADVHHLATELRDSEAKEAALQLEIEQLEAFGCEALSDEEAAGRYDPTSAARLLMAAKVVADADAKYQASLDAQFSCEDTRQELIAVREAYRKLCHRG